MTSALCAASVAPAQSQEIKPPPVFTPLGATRAVPGGIFLGRIESCAINPPLALFTENVVKRKEDGNYLLQPGSASTGTVTVAALVGESGSDSNPPTALILDKLSLSTDVISSATGESWKIFDVYGLTPSGMRLTSKAADYSVCKVSDSVLFDRNIMSAGAATLSNLVGTIAYSSSISVLNILGLKSDSYVRLRLSSVPSEADIFLDGIRQPPRTDTVLDVIAAAIPRISIKKNGYESCSLGKGNLTLESGSIRVINATCDLVPAKRKRRR